MLRLRIGRWMIARLANAVRLEDIEVLPGSEWTREGRWAKMLTGLLREVDPNIDPEHIAHLPAIEGSEADAE